jgi:hypothetical protein
MMRTAGERLAPVLAAAFIVGYAALLLSQLSHGLASMDPHGIIGVTQNLIDHHSIAISRPPGHPTTEFYLFGFVAWVEHLFGRRFDETTYLVLQGAAAVATLLLFHRILRQLGARGWQSLLALVCLACSAQFFANAIDGEEFLFALFFLLLSLRFLLTSTTAPSHLFFSVVSFGLATGCRPEIVFAALIYPLFFWFEPQKRWKQFALAAVVGLSALIVVWLPVLLTGTRKPYDAHMGWRDAILVGGYKLLFQAFGLFVFALLAVVLARAILAAGKTCERPFPQNFIFTISWLVPLVSFLVFFCYATKPSYVLPALPFLLILLLEWRTSILLVLTVLTLLQCFCTIDIFQDRQLRRPFLTRGSMLHTLSAKPYYTRTYLAAVAAQCDPTSTAVVADAFAWDFEYQIAHHTMPLRKRDSNHVGTAQPAEFTVAGDEHCLLLPRDATFDTAELRSLRDAGYQLKIESALYHEVFARYQLHPDNSSAPVPFSFFAIPHS